MKKITYLLSGLLLLGSVVFAQNNTRTLGGKITPSQMDVELYKQKSQEIVDNAQRTPTGQIRCLTAESEKLKNELDPNYQTTEQFEEWIAKKIKELPSNPNYNIKASRNIPVVVHVLYGNSTQNISTAQIQDQIDIMNKDFSATNTDIGNTPAVFSSAVGNMDIQFCLAQTDPSGNPTNGIDRISIPTTSVTDAQIETNYGLNNMWDPTKYFNIFVANVSGGLLGKAVFPTGSGLSGLPGGSAPSYDGIMVAYTAFGSIGTAQAPYNKGRSATHETGHWLGLRHIWGDGTCATDYCSDTPPAQTSNFGCPSFPHNLGTCSGNTTGEMTMNYMDYTDDACMYMFTNDQKTRMDAVLLNSPQRKELLTSNVCGAAALDANFTANTTNINVGQTVTFTDASTTPNTLNGWSWNFDVTGIGGVSPATASTQGPHVVTYNTAGTFTVSLQANDNAPSSDTETKTAYITVNPPGTCDSTAANWDINTDGASSGVYTWGAGNGYVIGQNTYGDNGWADKVTYSTTGKELSEVIYFFGVASGTGNVNLKVWGETAAKPGSVMSTQSVAISSLATGGNGTLWTLSPAPAITGNFYVGYDHTALTNGDTAACYSATKSTNSLWAYESTPVWTDLSAYGVVQGMAMIPVICDISTGEKEILGDINEVSVFPNPSNGTVSIALPSKVESTVEVYNVVGKLVYSNKPFNTQLITIDINNQPNGVYFINVKTGKTVTTKKIILSK